MYNNSKLKHIGLQFFAEPNIPPAEPPADPPAEPNIPPAEPPADPPAGKTYTQKELNALLANEKRTARQATLKELGIELKDAKNYNEVIKAAKETLDAGKTQAEKDAEAKNAAEAAQKEAEAKAAKLEMKVAALAAGVNPKFLDDVIVLAQAKVTEENPVETVMEEFKTKYPAFFTPDDEGDKPGSGTGGSTNPPRKNGATSDGLGKRLAGSVQKSAAKSSYFNH